MAGSAKSWSSAPNLSELNSMFTGEYGETNTYQNPQAHIDTKAAAFETANGESILTFYNPYCLPDMESPSTYTYTQPKMCANFIYDLNGLKGPNTVDKDIGVMVVLYPIDSIDGARKAWRMDFNIGNRLVHTAVYNANVLCIKR